MITNGEQSDEVDKSHYIALKSVCTDLVGPEEVYQDYLEE